MIDVVKVDKYTVEIETNENNKFISRVLRNNEEWIDKLYIIEGGNCIVAMAHEIMELREFKKNIIHDFEQLSREYWQHDKVYDSEDIDKILEKYEFKVRK